VTAAVDADDRPTDERATELLGEAEKLLSRIRAVRDALDDVDEGSIVLIEEWRQHDVDLAVDSCDFSIGRVVQDLAVDYKLRLS